ncbi:MAG: hypothetical protein R6W73_01270 [Candidatus Saliniplasma sp.]
MKKKWTIGLIFSVVSLLVLSSFLVLAGPALPFERYGQSNIDGSTADDGCTVTSWINGTEYGDAEVEQGDGSYQIFTEADDETDTTQKQGGENGELITYRIEDLNGNVYIANEVDTFDSGGDTAGDLNFATGDQPSTEVVINELVVDPDDGGTQYVYLYEPTGSIDLTRWRLEDHSGYSQTLDTLDTQYHPDNSELLYVDLEASPLGTDAGHFMLSWDPAGSGVAQDNWVVMDRVEYGGTNLNTSPENTIHEQHPNAPGSGEGLIRDPLGEDTDNSSADFTIGPETGRPISDPPGPVYNLHVEKDEANNDIILSWDEEPDADEYNVYHSTDAYADFGTWTELDTVTGLEYTHGGALGGDNYYIVRAENAAGEGGNSTMGYCYEAFFDSTEGILHFTSVPNNFDYNGDGQLTSFDVIESITGGIDQQGNLDMVVKWDASGRGYTETSEWDDLGGQWGGEFDIQPGDGIGLEINGDVEWTRVLETEPVNN